MTETVELSIDSKIELVETVGSVAKDLIAKVGFGEEDAGWIELAVHEAVINAITHGNKSVEAKQVDVKFVVETDRFIVFVRDRGAGFDLSSLPDPTDPQNLLNPSGRGILYMRTFMDEVEHSMHPDGGTVVRMTKDKRRNS
jgi:serine/threonine-protein kinase RsbW